MNTEPTESTGDDSFVIINSQVRIPLSALKFQFVRSAGAGGQHVNKTETAVELTFDLAHTPYLEDTARMRATQKLHSHLTADGILRVESRESRSQLQNREEAVQRFIALLRHALVIPRRRRPTRPTRSSIEERLQAKRRRSQSKQTRRTRPDM